MNVDISSKAQGSSRTPAVFLTGRFRSGSTLLWNLFRNMPSVRAYYEPCHDMLLAHIHCQTAPTQSHPGVSSYWDEYMPILEGLGDLHRPEFGVGRLCMEEGAQHEPLARYIEFLVTSAEKSLPVLKFNRVDFRLPWLRRRFPEARIVHIWRNSRDQWYSTVRAEPKERWGDPFLETSYELMTWSCALAPEFPFLMGGEVKSSYHRHYLLWRLSKAMGERASDLSLAFTNDLLANPGRTIAALAAVAGVDADAGKLAGLVAAPKTGGWREFADDAWFDAAETECDALLDELGLLRDFGVKSLAEIRAGNERAWARFPADAAREAIDHALTLYSRSRAEAMKNSHSSHQQHVMLRELEERLAAQAAMENR